MKTLDILRNSFGYEDFMCTYNDLNIGSKVTSLPKDLRKYFLTQKNKIKREFYEKYKEEYPDKILRITGELHFVHEVSIREILKAFNQPFLKEREHLNKLMA